MHVCAIMATCGRHRLCERSLRFFLDQDYKGEHTLLIFNNSHIEQHGGPIKNEDMPENKHLLLINQALDSETNEKYSSLGAIYRDALKHVPEDADIIVHWDDDDIFLPNHLTEGVFGLLRGSVGTKVKILDSKIHKAYKPAKSWYRHPGGVELMSNTLEPSIFVEASHIKEHGYSLETTAQHLQWVNPLVYEEGIFVDENGPATLIYNWGDTDIATFKTSGDAGNPNNFDNYRSFSRDHGDGLIIPWTKESVQQYYNLIKNGDQ